MRDIKFRAYVRFLREMHEVREMFFDKDTVMIEAYPYGLDKDDAPIMQFTGLRGLGGTDVYEGDIVRFDVIKGNLDHDQYERDQVGEVRIAPNGVSFGGWRYGWVCNIDVIGNIHQNPELLEKKQ